jgi:O-antigen ligase
MVASDLTLTDHPPTPSTGTVRRGGSGSRWTAGSLPVVVALVVATAVGAVVVFVGAGPVSGPIGLALFAVAAAGGAFMLGSPTTALILLIFASFTRLAIKVPGLPAEPMVLIFCALLVAMVIAGVRGIARFRFGWLEAAMLAYFAWNVVSALVPHLYPAAVPTSDEPIVVYRFILTGTVIPFVAYIAGRSVVQTAGQIWLVLYCAVAVSAYSAVVSVMQFTGPFELVWPRFIVDAPNYPERANGIFNQPVVNGLVMVAGFVTAVFLMHERTLRRFPRIMAGAVAVACVPGIYLTRTRAVWLVFGVGLVMCAIFARGRRTGFLVTILGAAGFVAATWSTFTSSDRAAGGVGSVNEVDDRFNSIATSLWAIQQEPLSGWGIARFAQVNTFHHQKWEESMPFMRGYAIASHENELGIATELGLIGLALWLAVLGLLMYALYVALRRLAPLHGLAGRPLGLLALTVFGTWVVCGFTVDLRFFDFANLLVFLLVGMAVGRGAARTADLQSSGAPAADVEPPGGAAAVVEPVASSRLIASGRPG